MRKPEEKARQSGSVGFTRSVLTELAYNIKRSKAWLCFDVGVLVLCALLFLLNDRLLLPSVSSLVNENIVVYLLACHGNDLLGGCAFLAYTNILIDAIKPEVRFTRLKACLIFIFLCGLFWELAAPLFVEGSVGDPLDLLAYFIGAFVYWALACRWKSAPWTRQQSS